jgi:hypothetical protein
LFLTKHIPRWGAICFETIQYDNGGGLAHTLRLGYMQLHAERVHHSYACRIRYRWRGGHRFETMAGTAIFVCSSVAKAAGYIEIGILKAADARSSNRVPAEGAELTVITVLESRRVDYVVDVSVRESCSGQTDANDSRKFDERRVESEDIATGVARLRRIAVTWHMRKKSRGRMPFTSRTDYSHQYLLRV